MGEVLQVEKGEIHTRNMIGRLVEEAKQNDLSEIDVSNVEFVSRSVADEIVHQMDEHQVEFRGMSGDVKKMVEIVKQDQNLPPA